MTSQERAEIIAAAFYGAHRGCPMDERSEKSLAWLIKDAIDKAVAAEREVCIHIAESIAESIQMRKEKSL